MAKPIAIQMSMDIAATPAAVWAWLVDWERLGSWMLEATDFQVVGAQREGVGTRATAMIRIGGIKTEDPIRVTRWEPLEVLEIEHLGWVKGTGTIRLSPSPRGTHLFWREVLEPPWGPLGAVGMRIFKPLMKKTFVRDLLVLKDLLEGSADGGPR